MFQINTNSARSAANPARKMKKYNFLTFVKEHGRNKHRAMLWECLCDCGTITIQRRYDVLSERVMSCGCYGRSKLELGRKLIHGMADTPTYNSWMDMKARCRNKNHKDYAYYGGRGIKVCKRWMDFRNFIKDMGDRPLGLTIERINNDSGYKPSNCRWATRAEQNRNKRPQKRNEKTGRFIKSTYISAIKEPTNG